MISPKVKHFVFNTASNERFSFIPGQFITVHFEKDGKELKRSYSIANKPGTGNHIEFAAGYVAGGPGTELLFNLAVGDTLQVSGPYGRMILKDADPKRYVLVGTSTGITPYRAMLDALASRMQQNPELEVLILQGVQHQEDVLYSQDFKAFCSTHPKAQFRACLSRAEAINPEANEYQGYVQKLFSELNLNPEQDMVYLCGNPGMIDDSFEWLKEHGFTTQNVIREKYISR